MYVMMVTNNPNTMVVENGELDVKTLSGNVLGIVTNLAPETFAEIGDVEFHYVTNRVFGNHTTFLIQLTNVPVNALALIIDAGKFSEAEREEFMDELLNSSNAANVLESLPVGLTRTYNGEIMTNLGEALQGNISAGLLRGPRQDDVYLMFYPGVCDKLYEQFTNEATLDNWSLTRGCKLEAKDGTIN